MDLSKYKNNKAVYLINGSLEGNKKLRHSEQYI